MSGIQMPYIKQEDRDKLDPIINLLRKELNALPDEKFYGCLNYTITTLVKNFGYSYFTYNNLIGVLECVKLELYRKAIAKYEDKKAQENGDVYEG